MDAVNFIVDCMSQAAGVLNSFDYNGVSILLWYVAFIVVNMVVSVFWRGARG